MSADELLLPATHQALQQYKILKTLSQSADAQTWQALDQKADQVVVIKALQFGGFNAWKRLQLFQREARVLASLNHPRIPRLLDFIRSENEQGLWVYLVYSWVEGESLAEKVAQHWLPEEKVLLRLAE